MDDQNQVTIKTKGESTKGKDIDLKDMGPALNNMAWAIQGVSAMEQNQGPSGEVLLSSTIAAGSASNISGVSTFTGGSRVVGNMFDNILVANGPMAPTIDMSQTNHTEYKKTYKNEITNVDPDQLRNILMGIQASCKTSDSTTSASTTSGPTTSKPTTSDPTTSDGPRAPISRKAKAPPPTTEEPDARMMDDPHAAAVSLEVEEALSNAIKEFQKNGLKRLAPTRPK